jgi:diaminopimelate epimerase
LVASAAVPDGTTVRGTLFYKMSGSGNDFVVLDGRSTTPDRWPGDRIRAICDRRSGVGADGLVILTPATADSVRMAYWNADGSHGALCGNAALCSGTLAVTLELVQSHEFCLLTDAGAVRVRSPDAGATVEINLPDVELPHERRDLRATFSKERWCSLGSVGVPHLVIRVDDVETVDVSGRGRLLRSHPNLGSEGANVNFISPAGDSGVWLIRTYERGVEAETLACGTGTVAAALALASRSEAQLPLRFRSRGGPELTVRADLSGTQASNVWLGGEGQLVFRGVWEKA